MGQLLGTSSKLKILEILIFEKVCVTLILLKIFDIYFCHYFATNMKIAIIHLWHANGTQNYMPSYTQRQIAEQHILRKYFNSIVYELQWITQQ